MVGDPRVPGLSFDAPATQALLTALVMYRLLPTGFANRDLRGGVVASVSTLAAALI